MAKSQPRTRKSYKSTYKKKAVLVARMKPDPSTVKKPKKISLIEKDFLNHSQKKTTSW